MSKGNANNIPMPPGPGKWRIIVRGFGTVVATILGGFDDCIIVELEDGAVGHIFNCNIIAMFQSKADAEAATKGSE